MEYVRKVDAFQPVFEFIDLENKTGAFLCNEIKTIKFDLN